MSSIIENADLKARRNFTYRTEKTDKWRSFADYALAGQRWTGDCDDLASTTADIAIRMGMKKSQLYFAAVASSQSFGDIDHLIVIAKDEKGKWWVLGDTFERAHPLAATKHKIVDVHNLTWPLDHWERVSNREMLSR